MSCHIKNCTRQSEPADLSITIYRIDDLTELIEVHLSCLQQVLHEAVAPDHPRDHGRIPSGVKCAFCAAKIPRIGEHALCFDVGNLQPPERYWAHPQCLHKSCVCHV